MDRLNFALIDLKLENPSLIHLSTLGANRHLPDNCSEACKRTATATETETATATATEAETEADRKRGGDITRDETAPDRGKGAEAPILLLHCLRVLRANRIGRWCERSRGKC